VEVWQLRGVQGAGPVPCSRGGEKVQQRGGGADQILQARGGELVDELGHLRKVDLLVEAIKVTSDFGLEVEEEGLEVLEGVQIFSDCGAQQRPVDGLSGDPVVFSALEEHRGGQKFPGGTGGKIGEDQLVTKTDTKFSLL